MAGFFVCKRGETKVIFFSGSSVLESDADSHIQHLIRMLGSNSYIGQRIMLSISQRICILAENLLLVDPFDDSFPDMNNWMFMM